LIVLYLILLSSQVISSGAIIFAQKPADIFNDINNIPSDNNSKIESNPIANEADNQPPCPKGT